MLRIGPVFRAGLSNPQALPVAVTALPRKKGHHRITRHAGPRPLVALAYLHVNVRFTRVPSDIPAQADLISRGDNPATRCQLRAQMREEHLPSLVLNHHRSAIHRVVSRVGHHSSKWGSHGVVLAPTCRIIDPLMLSRAAFGIPERAG